jgi:hypothetical protein
LKAIPDFDPVSVITFGALARNACTMESATTRPSSSSDAEHIVPWRT